MTDKPRFQSIDGFLSLLQCVEPQGKDEWKALCPNHYDRDPSLTITLGGNRILLHDFGGCETPAIVKALGLTMSHLFMDDGSKPDSARGRPRRGTGPRAQVAEYVYTDEHGKRLYRKLRYEPKGFDQERAEGVGGWVGGKGCLKGVRRVLWDLPRVLAADTVYWVEGEKDAINLATTLDVVATTCVEGAPMDAKKWKVSYATAVKGKHVVLVPDRDRAGIAHALFIAGELTGIAASIKVLLLPKGSKDITDWLAVNRKEEWEELLSMARDYTRELVTELTAMYGKSVKAPQDTSNGDGQKPEGKPMHALDTDIANAERLVAVHGDDLRYCYQQKKWLTWNGKVWQSDLGAVINQKAKHTVRSIYGEAACEIDDKRRGEIVAHARRSESDHRVKAMISRAESELPIAVADLDTDPWLLNCQNGIVDLRTGKLLPHDRGKYMSQITATHYDPAAECPTWLQFLEWATGKDADLQAYLQRIFGYALTGDYSEQVVFFLYGLGRNGKSTLLMTIRTMMGDYGTKLEADELMIKDRKSTGPKEALANLIGKRYVLGSEVRDNRRLDVGKLKDLTGGESIAADRKYEHLIEFVPIAKLFMYGNKQPAIQDRSLAIWRRVKLIRFEQTVDEATKDRNLRAKIEAKELPGVLAWAVRGCLDWQNEGLGEPRAVTGATEEYKEQQDLLGEWIWECCLEQFGAQILKSDLRTSYEQWCAANKTEYLRARDYRENLLERGIRDHRGTGGKHYWKGIRLLTDKETEARAKAAKEEEEAAKRNVTDITKAGDKPTRAGPKHEQSDHSDDKLPSPPATSYTGGIHDNLLAGAVRNITNITDSTDVTHNDEGDMSDLAWDTDLQFACGNCKGTRYWIRGHDTKVCARCHLPIDGTRIIDST